MRLFLAPIALVSVAAAALAGCSSSTDSEPSVVTDGGVAISAACAADTRKDIYTQGLTKQASDLDVVLVDSQFLPTGAAAQDEQPQKGMNSLVFQVMDANKAPVDNATVNLALFMPDHGHGSALTPTITPQGGGKYQITNVWLPMAGLWRFTVSVKQGDADLKETNFNFCVDG